MERRTRRRLPDLVTYKQAQEIGGQVSKGEHRALIVLPTTCG
ncbi:MAG: ArdC-like ssDNA-binding domain-containing protein [Alphaproteobacteria bacterium]